MGRFFKNLKPTPPDLVVHLQIRCRSLKIGSILHKPLVYCATATSTSKPTPSHYICFSSSLGSNLTTTACIGDQFYDYYCDFRRISVDAGESYDARNSNDSVADLRAQGQRMAKRVPP